MKEFFENFLMPTKTIYSMWGIMALILLFCFIATRKMKDVPGPLQNIAEMAVSGLLSFFSGVLGEKKARHYFPMLASFFVLIIVCNYSGLIPGAGELFTVPTSVRSFSAPRRWSSAQFILILKATTTLPSSHRGRSFSAITAALRRWPSSREIIIRRTCTFSRRFRTSIYRSCI